MQHNYTVKKLCARFLDTNFGFAFEQIRRCRERYRLEDDKPRQFHCILSRQVSFAYRPKSSVFESGLLRCPPKWSMGPINISNVTFEIPPLPSFTMILLTDDCSSLNAKYPQSYECKLRYETARNLRRDWEGEKMRRMRNDKAVSRKIGKHSRKTTQWVIYNRKRRRLKNLSNYFRKSVDASSVWYITTVLRDIRFLATSQTKSACSVPASRCVLRDEDIRSK